MSKKIDHLENIAYCELLISCQYDGCHSILEKSIDEPATDPVEEWAKRMAVHAREMGWSSDCEGRVLCPIHSPQLKESNCGANRA